MNTRDGKGFFEEKMANLKVFICESLQNISSTALHSRKQLSSALKYVVKMILIGNYTCSRSINEKSLWLVLRPRGIINISPNTRAIFQ